MIFLSFASAAFAAPPVPVVAPFVPEGEVLAVVVAIGDTGVSVEKDEACGRTNEICRKEFTTIHETVNGLKPTAILALGDLGYFKNDDADPPVDIETYMGRVHDYWKEFTGLRLPVRGNHELSEVTPSKDVAKRLQGEFGLPLSAVQGERLMYDQRLGADGKVCLLVADSAGYSETDGGPLTFSAKAFDEDCVWKIAVTHHTFATSYDKKEELADVWSQLKHLKPDIVVSAHAHQLEAVVHHDTLSVVSGAGGKAECPVFSKKKIRRYDGTKAPVACRPKGRGDGKFNTLDNPPLFVYGQLGFVTLTLYGNGVELRPYLVKPDSQTSSGYSAKPDTCWARTRNGEVQSCTK